MRRLQWFYACAIRTARCLGRDTALCCAAYYGHGATIAALVFAGADRGVSTNDGYSTRRGSAWVRPPQACGLGRLSAEKLAEEAGTLAEYEAAVRKVRLSAAIDWSGRRAVPARGRPRLAAAGGSPTAGAHACLRIPCRHSKSCSLAPVGEGGLGLQAHSSELAARGRRVRPCVRRTSVVV